MSNVLLVVAVASGVFLVYWSFGLARVLQTLRLPTARDGAAGSPPSGPFPSVCVVIPAHNEARNVAALVRSLLAQDAPGIHVTLALDRCTDGTAAVARDAAGGDTRLEIVEIDRCPPDWAGKVHAVWSAVERSTAARHAEYLLFADADTVFDPACVRACVTLAQRLEADLLSLLCTLTADRWFEVAVQPSAGMELMRQYPLKRANDRRRPRAFANGQFMLFRRDAYEALGGHAAVKDELLEDLALARLTVKAGRRLSVLLADGMVRCRMYESWPEFQRGWKRIYTEAAKRRADRLERWSWRTRAVGAVLPLVAALGVGGGVVGLGSDPGPRYAALGLGAAGLTAWLAVMVLAQAMARGPLWAAPLQVFGAWQVGGFLAAAARDLRRGTPTTWAGRTYVRPLRAAGSPADPSAPPLSAAAPPARSAHSAQ